MNKLIVSLVSFILLIILIVNISWQPGTIEYCEYDLNTIKEIIMNDRNATECEMKRLDINNDNKITSLDYVMIKNKMKGSCNE